MSHPDSTTLSLPDLDLLCCIGEGSFGHVWMGRNRTTGKLFAVKVIRRHCEDAADRAGREVRGLVRFEGGLPGPHKNLLAIHHVGQNDEFLYYTMDLADDAAGSTVPLDAAYRPATLARRLEAGQLSPEESLGYARQLLAGLAHLHGASLVHRDVKPANCVFVGGELKLADFSLLTRVDAAVSRLGTPRYMPPDGVMDAQADVYAAGLVIYEMITGFPAEAFPRWNAQAAAALTHPILVALNRLVLRACQRDRTQRFRDAGEMLRALEKLQGPAATPRKRRRGVLAVAASGIAALVVLVVLLLHHLALARVDVNFITIPYEAEIYLDGREARDAQGQPCTTPCTIPGLPARVHRVVFRSAGLPDLDVGDKDFGATREVLGKWHETAEP